MKLKDYLIETFQFNDRANKQVLAKIELLPERSEAVKFFSHLIVCQYNWMKRITEGEKAQKLDWWNPIFQLDELGEKWNNSLNLWLKFIESKSDEELSE